MVRQVLHIILDIKVIWLMPIEMRTCYAICAIIFLTNPVIGATFYLDPLNGDLNNDGSFANPWSTLEQVIEANYIVSRNYAPLPYDSNSSLVDKNTNGLINAGDTLMLMEGLHGAVFLRNYINKEAITIMAFEDHEVILEKVQLQACKNWNFKNIHISSEPYGYYLANKLFFIESHGWQGPTSHVNVEECKIYSAMEPWSTAQEWLDFSSFGLFIQGDSCIAKNNLIMNVDMGLSCVGDYIVAEENQIINFSGDGGRVLGSHISFSHNLIKNNYKVDDNHDDGIQSFTTNGHIVNHNRLIGNMIINTDDDTRPLIGPLQGIACFDGFYNHWLIANNIIHVDHWHGITMLGANQCTIIHNTVIDPTPLIDPGASWIRIDDHKDGAPSTDCVVVNNVANQFNIDGLEFNNVVLDSQSHYDLHFSDFRSFDFTLKSTSSLIDAADPSYSITTDFDKNLRDNMPDIGAYERLMISTLIDHFDLQQAIKIYPNPVVNEINVTEISEHAQFKIFNTSGHLMAEGNLAEINNMMPSLLSGCYILDILNEEGRRITTKKIVK